jgi:uncharacterized membrane protein (DUF373 family)
MDIQEINVNSHNVMESIQQIQMFVLVKEVAIFSITALALQDTQEFNVDLLNVMKLILQIPVFVQVMDLVVP